MTPVWLTACYFALIGAAHGSFAAAMRERIPAGRSTTTRSTCACGRPLTAVDLIPILGWLRTRGTAPCCGADVPVRLLWWEAIPATLAAAATIVGGWPLGLAAAAIPLVSILPALQQRHSS